MPTDAAEWIARFRSGTMSAEEAEALEQWLAQSDENRQEYEALSMLLLGLDGLRSHPEIMALREEARPPIWMKRSALVAAMFCVLLTSLAMTFVLFRSSLFSGSSDSPLVTAFYETRAGQTSSLALTDGSKLFLDASSAVRVTMDSEARQIRLLKGRANFIVAKNRTLPFKVSAGDRTITALGTQFDVNLTERSVEVVLEEGRVIVHPKRGPSQPGSSVVMSPGYKLVASEGNWTMAPVNIAALSRWRKGTLVFEEARLGDIVAELNRYVPTQIVIRTPAIADRRMSAVLKAGDISTFLASVDAIGLASWRETPESGYELIEVRRKKI